MWEPTGSARVQAGTNTDGLGVRGSAAPSWHCGICLRCSFGVKGGWPQRSGSVRVQVLPAELVATPSSIASEPPPHTRGGRCNGGVFHSAGTARTAISVAPTPYPGVGRGGVGQGTGEVCIDATWLSTYVPRSMDEKPPTIPPTPLDTADGWDLVPGAPGVAPMTGAHPVWQSSLGRSHYVAKNGGVVAWVAGDGTARRPWIIEVFTEGRWPTLEEIRAPMLAFTTPGATFVFLAPFLCALPFTDYPPILLVQTTAAPGSEAEKRLTLSGGLILQPGGNHGNEGSGARRT